MTALRLNSEINLNTQVRVRLSELGLKRYRKIYGHDPVLTSDGEWRDQLWSLMRDFGDLMGNGLEMPFESTTMLVEPLW